MASACCGGSASCIEDAMGAAGILYRSFFCQVSTRLPMSELIGLGQ
jgi:hypothetical protein